MAFDRNSIKESARGKVRGKLARKAKDPNSFGAKIADLGNDEFFTWDFRENHVVREEPSESRALEIARERDRDLSTLLFLPSAEFTKLADDIRRANLTWDRTPPRDRQLFYSDDVYTCITVTRASGVFQAGESLVSRIEYAVQEAGTVKVSGGKRRPYYAIGHLETTSAVGNADPDGGGSSESEKFADRSDEDEV